MLATMFLKHNLVEAKLARKKHNDTWWVRSSEDACSRLYQIHETRAINRVGDSRTLINRTQRAAVRRMNGARNLSAFSDRSIEANQTSTPARHL